MPDCEFQFDKRTYISGDTVVADIVLNIRTVREIKAIRCVFKGMAKVTWADTLSRYPKIYTAEEVYVHVEKVVRSKGTLESGEHKFNLKVDLPKETPTSNNAEYGRISYELQLIVEATEGQWLPFKQELLVVSPYDINKHPALKDPISVEDVSAMCCWPCKAGPIIIHMRATESAFLPGQQLPFVVEVHNKSKHFKFSATLAFHLLMVHKFTASLPRRKTRYKSFVLGRIDQVIAVKSDEMSVIENFFLVPKVQPTSQYSRIFMTTYELRLDVSRGGTKLGRTAQAYSDLTLPIVIGTPAKLTHADDILRITHTIEKGVTQIESEEELFYPKDLETLEVHSEEQPKSDPENDAIDEILAVRQILSEEEIVEWESDVDKKEEKQEEKKQEIADEVPAIKIKARWDMEPEPGLSQESQSQPKREPEADSKPETKRQSNPDTSPEPKR